MGRIWMVNSEFVGLDKGSTMKKSDGIQRCDVAVVDNVRWWDAWQCWLNWRQS